MKIIIINDYASVQGGAAQIAISSARGLADNGVDVTFIFATGEVDTSLNHANIKLINFQQYDLLSNPSRLNAAKVGIWNYSVEKRMYEILNQFNHKETVVHMHSWVKAFSASVISAILAKNFSLVVTLHDYFSICPNGGFYNYSTQKLCTLQPMSFACLFSNCDVRNYSQKLWRVLRQSFYVKAGIPKKIKNFIFVSRFSQIILQPYLPKNAFYWNIPNPIDMNPNQQANPENSDIFTFVGRLSEEKGVLVCAEASKKAKISTCFVGSGKLEAKIKEINPEAKLTGWANRENVAMYIKNSRALIFPSQLYETQGLVVVEAAALGVPSIVSNACAASEYIIDGETGLLFDSGNSESLIEKIKILSENPMLAKKMGENAYKKYWNNPNTLKKHINELLSCYYTVLNNYQKESLT